MNTIRRWLGEVVVDTGHVLIVDPCPVPGSDSLSDYGVVFGGFGGDGVYAIYGYYTSRGQLTKVVIDFESDYTDEDDDYDE